MRSLHLIDVKVETGSGAKREVRFEEAPSAREIAALRLLSIDKRHLVRSALSALRSASLRCASQSTSGIEIEERDLFRLPGDFEREALGQPSDDINETGRPDRLADRLVDRLADRLADRLSDGLADWLADRLATFARKSAI